MNDLSLNSRSSAVKSVVLAALFLVVVNLGSGYLAVELGYPSLWGNSTGIFMEYALPLNFNWAFAHLVSMLPLAVVVFKLPGWSKSKVERLRWVLLAALVVLFLIEVRLPYGRLNHIPFALFLVVDCLVLLLLSLIFYPPIRVLVRLSAVIAVVAILWQAYVNFSWPEPAADEPSPPKQETSFFEDVTWLERPDHLELALVVRATTGPNVGPSGAEICGQARPLAEQREGNVTVRFLVHPPFELERKYVHHAGSAMLSVSADHSTSWRCDFVHPTEPES